MQPRLLGLDLDGTLLDGRSRLSAGRSLYSAQSAMDGDFPVDYLVFSSGCGVVSWPDCRLLYQRGMAHDDAWAIARVLLGEDLAFMAHRPVPRNHEFCYHGGGNRRGEDFGRRVDRYSRFAEALRGGLDGFSSEVSFFLVMLQPDVGYFAGLSARLSEYGSVVRSTSPIDGESLWLEVYPHGVCKGSGLSWLAQLLLVPDEGVVVLGNDYNDLGMLEWFDRAYVVGNAPEALRGRFAVVADNEHDALVDLVGRVL